MGFWKNFLKIFKETRYKDADFQAQAWEWVCNRHQEDLTTQALQSLQHYMHQKFKDDAKKRSTK